jgi:AraC-like DNA-binding protein
MTAVYSQIEKAARLLPQPKSLFSGVECIVKTLPGNVLQFHRRDETHMAAKKAFFHHRFVLIACLHESGHIILDGEVFRIDPGQGVLVFPYQSHYYMRFEHPRRISWLFTTFEYQTPDDLEPLRNTPFTYEKRDFERLLRVTEAYREWLKTRKDAGTEVPLETALLLSGLLQRQSRYIKRAGGRVLSDVSHADFFRKVALFIHRNLGRKIDVREIAQIVHLSSSRLRARFRHSLGISLGEFIRRTRIHRACALLHSTDLNITQVSSESGFDSLFSFSRAFRHLVGKPPTAFRKEMQ